MTRAEKIRAIADTMAGWDYEELLAWAQNVRAADLYNLSDEQLDKSYTDNVSPP